jgi:hypothetical protein
MLWKVRHGLIDALTSDLVNVSVMLNRLSPHMAMIQGAANDDDDKRSAG